MVAVIYACVYRESRTGLEQDHKALVLRGWDVDIFALPGKNRLDGAVS